MRTEAVQGDVPCVVRLRNRLDGSKVRMLMRYNLPDRVLKDIVRFAEDRGVDRVILFGSRARGTNMDRSDVDIAVAGGDYDGFYWDVKEKIFSLLMFDVVELDKGISDDLKYEIERDGITLYEKTG